MAAGLYYDGRCGPCTWFARVSAATSRGRIRIDPLDGPSAERDLRALPDARRFGFFHIVRSGRVYTGPEALPVLIELTAGRTAGRVVHGAPFVRAGLEWVYQRFWDYRRTKGCAARAVPA
jgi:predicted DCC family thiol-disulfide oxidoreductase YuxK